MTQLPDTIAPPARPAPRPPAWLRSEPPRAGAHTLHQLLRQDGLGQTFQAWDYRHGREALVKVLAVPALDAAVATLDAALMKHAHGATALDHPGIAAVHEIGADEVGVYVAMEWLSGRPLAAALTAGWQPSLAQTLQMMSQVAQALIHAHAHGVIHGDLHPGTIVVQADGRTKLVDFGLARAIVDAGLRPDAVLYQGLPAYQAPELQRGEACTEQGDVYAFGVVAYELLAGQRAFHAAARARLRAGPDGSPWVPLTHWRPDAATPLCQWIDRAIDPNPSRRPSSLVDFLTLVPDRAADGKRLAPALRQTSVMQRQPRRTTRWAIGASAALGAVAAFLVGHGPGLRTPAPGRPLVLPPMSAAVASEQPPFAVAASPPAPAASALRLRMDR